MQSYPEENGIVEKSMKSSAPTIIPSSSKNSDEELKQALDCLEDAKAEDIITIDLEGKSSLGDYMVVATGRSTRHVGAIADQLRRRFKELGHEPARIEGQENCDWVLIDGGSIIVHIFRPEVREFYNIEKMWLAERPQDNSQ